VLVGEPDRLGEPPLASADTADVRARGRRREVVLAPRLVEDAAGQLVVARRLVEVRALDAEDLGQGHERLRLLVAARPERRPLQQEGAFGGGPRALVDAQLEPRVREDPEKLRLDVGPVRELARHALLAPL
jgi:hypothetical protein